MKTSRMGWLLLASALILASLPAMAQFNSGSTGEDGALNVTADTQLQVQEDGVHNYTTITVANGVTLSFKANSLNTPVILLAQGDVTINGAISLDGQNGVTAYDPVAGTVGSAAKGGPGGYFGGIGAVPAIRGGSGVGTPGGGPGGGAAATDPTPYTDGWGRAGNSGSHFTAGGTSPSNVNPAAPTYGDVRLITLSGGSGGAGSNAYFTAMTDFDGPGGGGGGGAFLLASSTMITVNGRIYARGGTGGTNWGGAGGGAPYGGGGAGGAIRLMANTISGTGNLYASGGSGASYGGDGLILLEAFNFTGTLLHNSAPGSRQGWPTVVSLPPANVPRIQIVSIGGIQFPVPPTGSLSSPDVTIPASTGNPMPIQIATTNIPDGAIIKLRIILTNGEILTVNSQPVNSGAATASVTLPHAIGVIYATADFVP